MIKQITLVGSEEQFDYLVEALTSAIEEAKEVLDTHESEDPPLVETQTLGEAAEDYVNLIASQKRRLDALRLFREKVGT